MSLSAVTLLLKRCCRDSARVARSSTHFMGVQRRFATVRKSLLCSCPAQSTYTSHVFPVVLGTMQDAKHAKKKPTLEQVATPLGRCARPQSLHRC
eukprot:scaffold578_cov243-Pinguiococcus_pyrenoidosus.AAC.7